MFPESPISLDVRLMENRRTIARSSQIAALAATPHRSAARNRIHDLGRRVLASVLNAIPDSRDGFRTKDLELATWGVNWRDSETDHALAIELRAATLHRRAGDKTTELKGAQAHTSVLPRVLQPRFGR